MHVFLIIISILGTELLWKFIEDSTPVQVLTSLTTNLGLNPGLGRLACKQPNCSSFLLKWLVDEDLRRPGESQLSTMLC